MGRRKERRMAAMAASGRRVKLDLFLDPSPGEASLKEGVGGENHEQQTGVSTSSSSACGFQDVIVAFSVHKKENPLALLGQYSDDDEEEDEASADQPNDKTKGSSTDVTDEHGEPAGDNKGNAHSELSAPVGVQQEVPQADDIKKCAETVAEENSVAPQPTPDNDSVIASEAIPDSSGMQIVGDLGGNWKAVMHGQSSQCYYWNTVTGETSWDIPNGLTLGVAADVVTSASVPAHIDYSLEAQAHVLPHNNAEEYSSGVSLGNGAAIYATLGMECGSGQLTHDSYAYAAAVSGHESTDIDPLQLAKYSADLLQRLKLLERVHGSIDSLELIKREIEIRMADCSALASYGSSLLPLWLHAEVHLKQLEHSVSKLEASYTTEPAHMKTEDVEHKGPNQDEAMVPSNGESLKFDIGSGVNMDENIKMEEPSSTSPVQNLQEKDASEVPSKVESDNDEDMDVEMEVDEENVEEEGHSSSMPNKEQPPSQQVRSPNLSSLEGSTASPEDNDIPPPPPEEEWIPPPPPENEPAPPPPPEEPVVSYAHTDTTSQPYVGEANLSYALPGIVGYYAVAGAEGTNGNYYMQVSESHVIQPQQHSYYTPVSASDVTIPVEATHTAAVPVEAAPTAAVPVSYYSYPSATMVGPGVAAEPSGYYASSLSAISSSALDNPISSTSVVSANSNVNPMESDKVIYKEAEIAPLSQVAGATSASGTTSILGSSTQPSTSTTNQTKVVRSKKRAVAVASSLRSNKKVASLVDKWKAAKEELRDDEEDEPESALEALERKRQKEIEEWHKQQIETGEAQENANFTPLGGDWRDRVKRRRAEAKKESKKGSTSLPVSATEQHKGQPDLAVLSKGLPSGWQAYLDESTKQVYYGNSLTSETSWDRPTK